MGATTSADTALARWARRLDRVALASGSVVAWLIAPMVLSLCYEVVARYLFNAPTIWAYDMTFMLYGSFFMLGAAFTLQRRGHVRTDSFYADWSPRRQAWVDLACYVLMLQGVSECLKCLHTLKTGQWPDRPTTEAVEVDVTA